MNKDLTEAITPDYLGIIWVTKDKLNRMPKLFKQIDYLFEGLLTRSMAQNIPKKKALYMGKSYGHPFFLAHFVENNPDFDRDMDETIKMVSKLNSSSKKILVISERKFNFKSFRNFHLRDY
ncbi:MAG: hypothetical protein E2O68_03675 [Deltaproteobacteria bacterium]|nr:MAG: hypothetical protein E2O68_03675 [Deltaproteobacteria bacterium]